MSVKEVSKFVVGSRIVYKGDMANVSGVGLVSAVVAKKVFGQMYSVNWSSGKMEAVDSSVAYDIALNDGRLFAGVYASNIGGEFNNKTCRFMLLDEGVAPEAEVAMVLAGVAFKKASDAAKADEAAAVFAAAKVGALAAGKALGLVSEDEFKASGKKGSAAASNLRAELKAAKIKASVKQSSYTAIDVTVAAADVDAARAIAGKYKAGNFDGMTDCYEYNASAWGSVFGDVNYVFVRGD